MTFTMDTAGILAILIQFVLPLVVGLVTKRQWSGGLKAVLLLALTAVTQFITIWSQAVAAHVAFGWKVVVWNVVIGFVISVAVHFGLWKPTGASDAATDTGVKDNPPTAYTRNP